MLPAPRPLLLLAGMLYINCVPVCSGPAIQWTIFFCFLAQDEGVQFFACNTYNSFNSHCRLDSMGFKNEITCADKADGYYANSLSNEGSFYRCKDKTVVRCERDQCNTTTTDTNTATLEISCDASEGFFTTPGTLCRGYYKCSNGTRQFFTCPPESFFDLKSQFCVQTGGMCYELVCAGRVNGRYADTTHGCQRSYRCEGGQLRSLSSCRDGSYFNGTSCQPNGTPCKAPPETSAVAVHILATDPCTDLPDSFQTQEDESCRGYLLCHSGQTIAKLRCAPGDYFNGIQCAPANNASCVSYCAGKPDGYETDLRRQCRGYVECLRGKVVEELSCKEGLLYNGKACVSALLYRCPVSEKKNICSKLQNGYHQDYMTGCRDYFYCNEGILLLRSMCRDGKVWNGSDCVPPTQFLCQGPEVWPGCDGFEDGLYSDLSKKSNCKFYHYCSHGKRVRLKCQDGFLFNGKTCVKNDTYACPKLDAECANKRDGYNMDIKSDCHSYYYCSDGQKITYVCPDKRVFNGSECVEPTNYNCRKSVNKCTNKTNGYHPDKQSGCHKYVYCLQGVTITTLECPEHNVFDGRKCTVMRRDNCNRTVTSCDRAENGLYIEPNSHCTRYFRCLNSKKTKSFACREGTIFNGVKCVKYMCPNINAQLQRRDDCVGKIGFFQDYGSRCKKYYFCISGAKTELSCKNGQVFNGEVCTSERNYTCPVDE